MVMSQRRQGMWCGVYATQPSSEGARDVCPYVGKLVSEGLQLIVGEPRELARDEGALELLLGAVALWRRGTRGLRWGVSLGAQDSMGERGEKWLGGWILYLGGGTRECVT